MSMKNNKKKFEKINTIIFVVFITPLIILALLYSQIKEFVERVILRKPQLSEMEKYVLERKEWEEKIARGKRDGILDPNINYDPPLPPIEIFREGNGSTRKESTGSQADIDIDARLPLTELFTRWEHRDR